MARGALNEERAQRSKTTSEPSPPVLYYDGTCGLCARCVQWSLRHDHRRELRFAPLQGASYAALSVADKPREVETMVIHDQTGLHVRSNAVLRLLTHLGGIWRVLALVGRLCPRIVRDWLYDGMAKRRIAWFGTADVCDLPKPADRERFLA